MSRRLTRRGFLSAVGAVPLGPPPIRETVIHKGRSAGPTSVNLNELIKLLQTPMPRPDFVMIGGVLYSKDEPLPPPFGSEPS